MSRTVTRDRTVVVSTTMLRELARTWYLAGFRASGYQFHGERLDPAEQPAVRGLLQAEFDRLWAEVASGTAR